jgi:hypothetical protein
MSIRTFVVVVIIIIIIGSTALGGPLLQAVVPSDLYPGHPPA